MAHFLVSDEKYRDQIYDDGGASHRPKSPSDYRFGRIQGKPVRGSVHRFSGTFRRLVEAIVNSKLRRMEHELELRRIRIRDEH
jgi:hypothetical protein